MKFSGSSMRLKPLFLCLLAGLCLSGNSPASDPLPSDLNEGSRMEWDSTNEIYRFKWWGIEGRTYFIQQSETLMDWTYVPVVEGGNEAVEEWGFQTTGDRFFLRLVYTDRESLDPVNEDFDGDGVSNWDELNAGTDPFAWNDSDGDGIADGYDAYPMDALRWTVITPVPGDTDPPAIQIFAPVGITES